MWSENDAVGNETLLITPKDGLYPKKPVVWGGKALCITNSFRKIKVLVDEILWNVYNFTWIRTPNVIVKEKLNYISVRNQAKLSK